MPSDKKTPDLMADGWKWKVRGSRKLPEEPRYRRSLYFYHGQDGEERSSFKQYIYERLDNEYVLHLFNSFIKQRQ